MARGNSGRIVIEIETSIKDRLYVALAKDKITLKDWFIDQCNDYLKISENPKEQHKNRSI